MAAMPYTPPTYPGTNLPIPFAPAQPISIVSLEYPKLFSIRAFEHTFLITWYALPPALYMADFSSSLKS